MHIFLVILLFAVGIILIVKGGGLFCGCGILDGGGFRHPEADRRRNGSELCNNAAGAAGFRFLRPHRARLICRSAMPWAA